MRLWRSTCMKVGAAGNLLAPFGVVVHLDDEKPSVLIERERDWIGDEGLGGDKFQAKPLPELKGVQGLPRGHRREFRQRLRIHGLRLSGEQA